MIPKTAVPPGQTRVLLALVGMVDEGESITLRALGEKVGINLSGVHAHLWALRNRGLVSWADNHAGTLRPTVRGVRQVKP